MCPALAQLGLSGPSTVVLERDSSRQSWLSSHCASLAQLGPELLDCPLPMQTSRPEPEEVLLVDYVCVNETESVYGLLGLLAELTVTAWMDIQEEAIRIL